MSESESTPLLLLDGKVGETTTDPKKNIPTKNKIIIGISILVIFGALIIYSVLKKQIDNKVRELKSSKEEFIETDNTLKYYGAHYCPFSNNKSMAFKVIRDFKEKYPDVNVEVYMKEDNEAIFNKVRPQYVPTIMYNNKNISLSLPEEERDDVTDENAADKVLDNIYKQILIN